MKRLFIAVGLSCSITVWADPPNEQPDEAQTDAELAKPRATACAKMVSLMGSGCSYTTGMMAQRVLAEGKPFSFTGLLTRQKEVTSAGVAVPFTIGPQQDIHVIANEFVEELTVAGSDTSKLELSGKVLDVDGVRFFLVEQYKDLSS
jgi:hypothetical protein